MRPVPGSLFSLISSLFRQNEFCFWPWPTWIAFRPTGGGFGLWCSSRRGDNRQTAFEIIGDGGGMDLDGNLGQSSPAHATKAVASLPGAEDFLDPTAHPMDRPVPGIEPLKSFGLVTAPYTGGNDAWRATLCPHRIAEVISTISTVGTHVAGIVGQSIGAGLAVVDVGGMGSLAMVDRGFKADAGIMTEPTANRIAPLCHGILWGRIVLDGIGGHAELTPNAWYGSGPVDAVQLCRQVMDGIDTLNRRWMYDPKKNHPLMDMPNQIMITQLQAGEHPSSTAGRAEIIIDAQYLPSEKDEFGLGGKVKREIEEHIASVCQADPYLRMRPARIEWILDADCAETPADHPFVTTFQGAVEAAGLSPVLAGFGAHSDIGLPSGLGQTPTVNFGPGDPAQSHQPNERVSVKDLVDCTTAISLSIARWCQ